MVRRRQNKGRDISGWIALDKPVGMTSTQAVTKIKRIFDAHKAGHAGTLDPLASGCLPIALGEATKTVSYVMNRRKIYRFAVLWGIETTSDDAEGSIINSSPNRPTRDDIINILHEFSGEFMQVPPQFSALKVNGERAYDIARDGGVVPLKARPVVINQLDLIDIPNSDHAIFETECGKGTYIRSLARDMGRRLGTYGHIIELRRLLVGPFDENSMISLDELDTLRHGASDSMKHFDAVIKPVATVLDDIPAVAVTRNDAARLYKGQAIFLRGRDALVFADEAYALLDGLLIALGHIKNGTLHPKRVFNLLAKEPA